ncbi:hypothetical protein HPB49_021829 [Dermacentor silvarum]|uniref:Uncharacterized protein n=1 Tax=Dermacentor silvarum TaxID=543639 RepID=A0ACB8DFY8_DERSI|nr:hypothetical protein HPB49_021829 [Dermacentor silvarum]
MAEAASDGSAQVDAAVSCRPMERTLDDLDLIYEELLHIKALSHLSNSVKRELYGVMIFESHPKAGTILFNQGDEGNSWYIILRGSVNVVIYGKGVVCTLHEGDDFGKLALVNDAPRAATITTREDNCHFLRVDKEDFNRILRVYGYGRNPAKDVGTSIRNPNRHKNRRILRYVKEHECSAPQRWKVGPFGHIRHLSSGSTTSEDTVDVHRPIKPNDEIIFRVYCADHTYTTLKTAVSATAEFIKRNAAEKLSLKDDLVLVEVKSSGERIAFKDSEVSVPTGLSINGRIFISPADHLDALTPLSEQEGPVEGTGALLETLSSHDIAYHMSLYDWHLFSCIHEYELIYQVFGRHQFRKIMSNLDVFQRRFNEVQFWVVTEMCLANPIGRRVQLLRKFIKIASHCREYQNLNAFFAIVMGLSNVAVSRLSQTWERLPGKVKRTFAEFETLIDPSRNHRRYRVAVSKVQPPLNTQGDRQSEETYTTLTCFGATAAMKTTLQS